MFAKIDTAKTITVGPILDSDGAAKTDEVVASIKLAVNGGAPGVLDGSATLTHRNTGHYSLALTANDIDTLGTAEVVLDSGTNAMQPVRLEVVTANVYDSLFSTDKLEVDATQISGDSTAADILELFVEALKAETGQIDNGTFAAGAIDASAIATGAIDADALAADCITSAKIADDAIGDEHWNVTSVDAGLTDAAKLAIQQIAAGGIR